MNYLKIFGPIIILIGAFVAGAAIGWSESEEAWGVKWSVRDAKDLEANLAHEKKLREQESFYQKKINEANTNGQQQRKELEDIVSTGAAITERLRNEYQKLAAQSKLCKNTAVGNGSKSPKDPADMLAELLSRSEQRETEIARYADELAIARDVCEASYNALFVGSQGGI